MVLEWLVRKLFHGEQRRARGATPSTGAPTQAASGFASIHADGIPGPGLMRELRVRVTYGPADPVHVGEAEAVDPVVGLAHARVPIDLVGEAVPAEAAHR